MIERVVVPVDFTAGFSGRDRLLHGEAPLDLARRATVPVLIQHQV